MKSLRSLVTLTFRGPRDAARGLQGDHRAATRPSNPALKSIAEKWQRGAAHRKTRVITRSEGNLIPPRRGAAALTPVSARSAENSAAVAAAGVAERDGRARRPVGWAPLLRR